MEKELLQLYQETLNRWSSIWHSHNEQQVDTDEQWGDFLTNPYFICPSEKYTSSAKRGMIVAEETYSWDNELGEKDAMFLPNSCNAMELMSYHLKVANTSTLKSTIWNFYKPIEMDISPIPLLFNNLIKIGKCGRVGFVKTMQPHILCNEIQITKPSFLILHMGQKQYFDELSNNGIMIISKRPILSSGNRDYLQELETNLNIPVLLSDHPTYLSHNKVRGTAQQEIIKWINNI